MVHRRICNTAIQNVNRVEKNKEPQRMYHVVFRIRMESHVHEKILTRLIRKGTDM